MMDLENLIRALTLAQEAVSDVKDREIQLRAFEVILSALLRSTDQPTGVARSEEEKSGRASQVIRNQNSLVGRVLLLVAEGFFFEQRSLPEIQIKLAEHGWHYPQPNLSTPLMRLVRQRKLRRTQVTEGAKRLWKYSNP